MFLLCVGSGDVESVVEPVNRLPLTREPSPLDAERGRERDNVCNSRFLLCSNVSRFFSSCSFCCNMRCKAFS